MPSLTVAGTYNARSVDACSWLIRTAALDNVTESGTSTLRALDVSTVIDLREDSERVSVTHGIPVISVPVYRSADGPPVVGSLENIYEFLLVNRQRELTRAVIAVAHAPGTAVVHCTAGKDRTGLVVALCLLASGSPRDDVINDYVLSGVEVLPHRESLVAELLADIDLPIDAHRQATRLHLESPLQAISHALNIVDSRGGAEAYLRSGGATDADITALLANARS